MGLDQYAFKTKNQITNPVIIEQSDNDEEVFYWRKHPNLQGWMEKLYHDKGGEDDFNCVCVQLTSEDIDNLEKAVNGDELPETSGFFFGESGPEDKAGDLKFITLAREALASGAGLYYTSWW